MAQIISHYLTQVNSFSSQTTNGSQQPTNSTDLASHLLNQHIVKNIESYYRQFTKQEIEVFKYLMYYWRKFENIQIPILNICNRFKLAPRRVHYLLRKLLDMGILYNLKKGHTGSYTRRAMTDRGLILWKAISKGFGSVKHLLHKKNADSCADSPSAHSIYISSKEDVKPECVQSYEEHREELLKNRDMKSIIQGIKDLCRRE